jgi:glycosyltransferase involved in cell wall biosynthesis
MRITVCIPTVRPGTVADAVRSILAQTISDWELIVVGQGDEAALRVEVEAASQGDPRVVYRHLDRRGLSIARNAAIAAARGEIIAFTDDDCEAAPDWLERVCATFDQHPAAGLVLGSLVAPPSPGGIAVCPQYRAPDLWYDPGATGRVAPPGWGAVGANYCVRRSLAVEMDGFDEHLGAGAAFPAAEETDLMLRAEFLDVPMCSTSSSIVHHTSGYRRGVRAVYRHRTGYAVGNGALAAKLTLIGDARGPRWLRDEIRLAFVDPIQNGKPWRIPGRLLRLAHFVRGYQQCRRRYSAAPTLSESGVERAKLARRSALR